jgi:predicted metal-binding protein
MTRIFQVTGKLVINPEVRGWCKLPYPGHPRGCPNFGKRADCPPRVGIIGDFFDLSKKHWLIVLPFDLAAFKEKMRIKHPAWSERQLGCCIYWQAGVKRRLREACLKFMAKYPGTTFNFYPEAMGVNVFLTLAQFGYKLERRPIKTIYKVALVGYPG